MSVTMKKTVFLLSLMHLTVCGFCQDFTSALFPKFEVDYAKERVLEKMSCNDSLESIKDRLEFIPLYRVTPSDHCPDSVFPFFWRQAHNCYADSSLYTKDAFLSKFFFAQMAKFKYEERKSYVKNYFFIEDLLIYDSLDECSGYFFQRRCRIEPFLPYCCNGEYGKSIIQLMHDKTFDYIFDCEFIGRNSDGFFLNNIVCLFFVIKGQDVFAILPNDGSYLPLEDSGKSFIILTLNDFKEQCWEQFTK